MSFPSTDQPTNRSPQANLADRRWRLRHSAWLLAPLFGFGFFSFVGFLYIAARARKRQWWIIAAGYALAAVLIGVLMETNGTGSRTGSGWGGSLFYAVWIGGIIQAVLINPEWLRWRASSQPWYAQQGTGPANIAPVTGQSALPPQLTGLGVEAANYYQGGPPAAPAQSQRSTPQSGQVAATAPLKAPQAGAPTPVPGRPRITQPLGTADVVEATVDVNTATEADLMSLPGLTADIAAKLVQTRTNRGGFTDVDDFARAAQLQPHEFVRMRSRIVVSARPQQIIPPMPSSGRILDV